uniref:Secreted protein n=1 Tax=Branchiostoma floridae TaxID=7739 RepID=C3ZG96_BRAFL|eukprot:XP_002592406.1 hypothetical protein BRAFLDRAFT_67272 [Branchiostoma floridae]
MGRHLLFHLICHLVHRNIACFPSPLYQRVSVALRNCHPTPPLPRHQFSQLSATISLRTIRDGALVTTFYLCSFWSDLGMSEPGLVTSVGLRHLKTGFKYQRKMYVEVCRSVTQNMVSTPWAATPPQLPTFLS